METPMTYFMEDPKPEDVIFYKKYWKKRTLVKIEVT